MKIIYAIKIYFLFSSILKNYSKKSYETLENYIRCPGDENGRRR
jgi:hypothetical protein